MEIASNKYGAIYEKILFSARALHSSKWRGGSILIWRKFTSHVVVMMVLLFGISAFSRAGENPVQPEPAYRLRLYHTHTNERIDVVYRVGDNYIPSAIDQLDQFLRDHRTGDVIQLDRRVFDLLHDLTAATGHPDAEIDIVCGYRTPWSNEFLRRTTQGVASHSLHMQGEAIDIRMPGVSTAQLRDVALTLHRGGVGYYPESRFVHVDVGRVRRW
jgi:uncharacterized protein YcbK (DUF882 family)